MNLEVLYCAQAARLKSLPLIQLGTNIKPWGKLHAYLWIGGERYYMFIDKNRVVSLIPATAVSQSTSTLENVGGQK